MQIRWHIGDIVAKLRDTLGWSQETLGRKAGVHATTIIRLESAGNSESITLEKVAHALGVSVAELYTAIPKSGIVVMRDVEAATQTVGFTRPKQRRPRRKTPKPPQGEAS